MALIEQNYFLADDVCARATLVVDPHATIPNRVVFTGTVYWRERDGVAFEPSVVLNAPYDNINGANFYDQARAARIERYYDALERS